MGKFKERLFKFLDNENNIDIKLDRIFDEIDLYITYKEWDIIKDIIDSIDITKYDEYILIAFLTITLSCYEKIDISRKNFYNRVEKELKSRNIKNYKQSLKGLE